MFSIQKVTSNICCRGQRRFLSSLVENGEALGRQQTQRKDETNPQRSRLAGMSMATKRLSSTIAFFPSNGVTTSCSPKLQHETRLCPFDSHPPTTKTATPRRLKRRPHFRTMMARSSVHADSEDPSLDPEAKAMTFLVGTLGHDKDVAKGVLAALKQSGVSGGPALLSMVRTLAGRWEVDEDAGLEALVESVTVELARSKGKKTVSVWILPASAWASKEGEDESVKKDDFQRAFKVEGFEDMSLTDVAKFGDGEGADVLGEMIECSCSGIMACSTCHVVVHPDWFEKVGEPEESELDMIDLAYNAQDTSRLGCQVILKPHLDNAIFKIPRGANNMMDFIPFEDD